MKTIAQIFRKPVTWVFLLAAAVSATHAGDILRGGATADPARRNAAARANSGAEAAQAAKRTAQDRLARTTRAIEALRNINVPSPNSSIPSGLGTPGGLVIANPASWVGANLPVQTGSTINIVQTAPTAQLFWESFNIARGITLNFDQSGGGPDIAQWIAYNQVLGNTPSRIGGILQGGGQVYLNNPNGITFEAGSRVQARTFVASTLPINSNLVEQGLLNNRDAQFLFSGLTVPGGTDGTSEFIPPSPPASTGQFGDISVNAGALLQSVASGDGNGGRLMLVAANIVNNGVLESPAGQTILAAGLQVGIQAHNQDDPSLRGLDVWVGNVGTYAGTVTNNGLIESRTGNIFIVGRQINQLGGLESSTTVNLNGRIDLIASYGAVGNPSYDNSGSIGFGGPPFVNQFTGNITFGPGSVTRILPDLTSTRRVPGTSLPERSRVRIEGLSVYFAPNSNLLVPSGVVDIRAGTWPYVDVANNRTTLDGNGNVETSLPSFISGANQIFFFNTGQFYADRGALLDVSGTTDAFLPLSQHILEVQLRGAELADSPLLRNSNVRGLSLIVDIRRTGTYGGRTWVGTPLGDLTGFANLIDRDVAQLTTAGGTMNIQAGNSIIVRSGATLDVSGGYFTNEGGRIQTTRLIRGGRHLIDIEDATPDVTYDDVYTGESTERSAKWGIERTFRHPLAPLGGYNQKSYVEGASGGNLTVVAPSMVLEGELLGRTVKGPRQQDSPPVPGRLAISFRSEKRLDITASTILFLDQSPTPPEFRLVDGFVRNSSAPEFTLVGGAPAPLPSDLTSRFALGSGIYDTEQGGGFGEVDIDNREGDLIVEAGEGFSIPVGGALRARAANAFIRSNIMAPGGIVEFTVFNFSPFLFEELTAQGLFGLGPAPAPVPGRGRIELEEGRTISVAGMFVDERPTTQNAFTEGRSLDGGTILLEGYSIILGKNTLLDASGGVWARPTGGFEYGEGGDISVLGGQDTTLSTSIGGEVVLDGQMQAYSASRGGTLSVRANQIVIGGGVAPEGGIYFDPSFFQTGGFRSYSLTGIGGRDASGNPVAALRVASGTLIEPREEGWILTPYTRPDGRMSVRKFVKPTGIRNAASLSLRGIGSDDGFTTSFVEAIGIVALEEGTRIVTDPGASVEIGGELVSVLGTIEAPGGAIIIEGDDSYPIPGDLAIQASFALPTVYLGPRARLSTAGTTVFLPDPFGRRSGLIYPGGTIEVSGNIYAEAGAVLDVSGASEILDFHPSRLGGTALPLVPRTAGLNALPWGQRGIPVRVETDGGLIDLSGSEFLYSDATLLGRAGGPSALGGRLSISSGRFYPEGESRRSSDINLVVDQDGRAADFGNIGAFGNLNRLLNGTAQLGALFSAGNPNPGIGYFAISQFERGGFGSLDLGYKFFPNASPIAFGGNVQFRGPVQIQARGFVRIAGGGVVQADSPVSISAPYIAIGQEFRPPLNPSDTFRPFTQFNPAVSGSDYFFPPTTGPGSLSLNARLIDVGTLSLQGISSASFSADGGDIRGNGTVNIAGALTLRAAQIYPTTLASFNIFAYDSSSGPGSVTILPSGVSRLPLSAGGSLNIYASVINQSGTLVAPFGSITLGWDGTDLDPSTPAVDGPVDPVGRSVFNTGTNTFTPIPAPVANIVTLASGSRTSVSGIDPATGQAIVVPFGISPEGLTWIDPRGVNVTVSGLPERFVSVSGNSVVTQSGSMIDIRGGGDLLAYRWVQGNGGTVDLLGLANVDWGAGSSYEAGDLVIFNGQTFSARVAIDPGDFVDVPTPEDGRFWTLVPEAYAVLPGYGSSFSAYNVFNTGQNASLLQGEPGYLQTGLRLGEQIYLENSRGLSAGFYTLLPRQYAVLPGAYLVIPQEQQLTGSAVTRSSQNPGLGTPLHPIGTARREEGSYFVSGFTQNSFHRAATPNPVVFSRFEVVPPEILAGRAEYDLYYATSFIPEAAARLDSPNIQRLPSDSGALRIQGNTSLILGGSVLAPSITGGRGATADISSFSDILLFGGTSTPPAGPGVFLSTSVLGSWNIENLLIGGLRRQTPSGLQVEVRTSNLTLDNPGAVFSGPDIALVSRQSLTVTENSSLASSGRFTQPAPTYLISGDGTAVRVSSDSSSTIQRSGLTGSTSPILSVGPNASLSGSGVILDSTYASDVDPSTRIQAETLTLASGQISILLEPQVGPLPGTVVDPHLVLDGTLLAQAESSNRLILTSYRMIDIYGDGTLGSLDAEQLIFQSAGIRGYAQGPGGALIQGRNIVFSNPVNVSPLLPQPPLGGSLNVQAEVLSFGPNDFNIFGYDAVNITATSGAIASADGSFATAGDMILQTPAIVGNRGVNHQFTAGGDLMLPSTPGDTGLVAGLGATLTFEGDAVNVGTRIFLPSGSLSMRARTGDLVVDGDLSVEGTAQEFYDLVRYSPAGVIQLTSDAGDVTLGSNSRVSVAGAVGGGTAGVLSIQSPNGAFTSLGLLAGLGGGNGAEDGTFILDTSELPSYSSLNATLDAGGFFQERSLRIRRGDVTVDGYSRARVFNLSADGANGVGDGNITVTGTIDSSGATGGQIFLAARGSLILAPTAILDASGQEFDNAGKGGSIVLEAGAAIGGVQSASAVLDLQAGSIIDLSVAESSAYLPGGYDTPGSAAFFGLFEGTLHLRAPRTATDLQLSSLASNLVGGSSVLVESVRVYNQPSGLLNNALRDSINTTSASYMNANGVNITNRLLGTAANAAALQPLLLVAPGAEVVNYNGDLQLGSVNGQQTEDWNLATFRYGPQRAPGVLTLRASGDILFLNTLSDGFDAVTSNATNGWSTMWLATLSTLDRDGLGNLYRPINLQSWSYRISAGADSTAANFRSVLATEDLAPNRGSVLIGEFYAPIPNTSSSGTSAATGLNGLTSNTIGISSQRTRFEVVRTGTGTIDVSAGRDIQLRNQFATIYTAGVALPLPTTVFQANDFVVPVVNRTSTQHPSQGNLGAIQQRYSPQWNFAGGNITLDAQGSIWRSTRIFSGGGFVGDPVVDSSRQLPTNWLYRRGYVGADGLFATDGGVNGATIIQNVNDPTPSTTWWIDFSNFFQGVGALGGGNLVLDAGQDIINVDGLIPTNARMAGRNPSTGQNIAPDAANLVEHGGGDLLVRAGNDISGGIYYVERGLGTLDAGGEITTNASRSPSLTNLGSISTSPAVIESQSPAVLDSRTWLPTTLYAGRTQYDVQARGDVLIGPTVNAFLTPQGLNNKFWYKTYFQTYAEDSSVTVSSLGGDVTHRLSASAPGGGVEPILGLYMRSVNLYSGVASTGNVSNFQPWVRLAETSTGNFSTIFTINAPTLRSTAFAGDINLVGQMNLFPSPTGTVELAAAGGVIGLQQTGRALIQGQAVTLWTSASVNLSDALPSAIPGILSPLAYQSVSGVGRNLQESRESRQNPFGSLNANFAETGSFTGIAGSIQTKRALHDPGLLHRNDSEPLRIYTQTGDITGFTLFSPKTTRIHSGNNITDVAFYIQNLDEEDVSIVSAAVDIIPNNENAPLRSLANDLSLGNLVADLAFTTTAGSASNALPGDIQIGGPGFLEVIAGRNLDLGTGANRTDGTGVGITSIGNSRNPFLPFGGAGLVVLTGVTGPGGSGPAQGLLESSLNLESFLEEGGDFTNPEVGAIAALDAFYELLRITGQEAALTDDYSAGYAAINEVFGSNSLGGEVFTRSRDIRTINGGGIRLGVPGGGITLASDIFGNPQTPPGIVTENGGQISVFTAGSVDIGRARIFTLRGGDITMWSSFGDIAAGTSPRTVVTAPPTRVLIDSSSATVQTDLGGLATGGGIGTLQLREDDAPSNVTLIAPEGTVDAGDAGIRATGNVTIAATAVLNADAIQAAGGTTGVPTAAPAAAVNVSGLSSASSTTGATTAAAQDVASQARPTPTPEEEEPSIIQVEILGYGGGEG